MNDLGHVKACHQPRNERCPHNFDLTFDCNCRPAEPVVKVRKPYRELRVDDPTVESHGLGQRLVLQVESNGRLAIREQGKRTVYRTTLGKIYEGLVWRVAMNAAKEKKAKRRARKGGRR